MVGALLHARPVRRLATAFALFARVGIAVQQPLGAGGVSTTSPAQVTVCVGIGADGDCPPVTGGATPPPPKGSGSTTTTTTTTTTAGVLPAGEYRALLDGVLLGQRASRPSTPELHRLLEDFASERGDAFAGRLDPAAPPPSLSLQLEGCDDPPLWLGLSARELGAWSRALEAIWARYGIGRREREAFVRADVAYLLLREVSKKQIGL